MLSFLHVLHINDVPLVIETPRLIMKVDELQSPEYKKEERNLLLYLLGYLFLFVI